MESASPPLCTRRTECRTLRARHLHTGTSLVLELSGEAEASTLSLLAHELKHLTAGTDADVVVDVTLLEHCDIASARLILGAAQTMPFSLRGETGSVKAVFDLVDALQRPEPLQASAPYANVKAARAA